jgi:hypothetical protein
MEAGMMPNIGNKMNKVCSFALVLFAICCGVVSAQPSPSPAARTSLEGVIVISPAYPGPTREGLSDKAPLVHTAFIVQKANETVASFTTDEKGAFRISLPPGHYTVTAKNQAPRIGRFGPFEVDLVEGQVTKVNWTCDSGMR